MVLGSTGSIGRQALEVAARHPERLQVVGLAAQTKGAALREQAAQWGVPQVALAEAEAAARLAAETDLRVHSGPQGLGELVRELRPDLVVAALSGGAGLASLLAALEVGADVALANKEPLVTAGHLVTEAARRAGAELLPVDSELSAIWQCLRGEERGTVEKVLLTASGGPFRDWEPADLASVTPAQALAHPTWKMGPKVTVDSATLMNKGFELFEVRWLFGVPFERIEVLLHPQSVMHSAVAFVDGSCLAQLGPPDMRTPIQFALSYPERWPSDLPRLDLPARGQLDFAMPPTGKFPCLRLARQAGQSGASYPAVLSAADEVAVEAFLAGRLSFPGIAAVLEQVLEDHEPFAVGSLAEVERAEHWAREYAGELIRKRPKAGIG